MGRGRRGGVKKEGQLLMQRLVLEKTCPRTLAGKTQKRGGKEEGRETKAQLRRCQGEKGLGGSFKGGKL